MRSGWKNMKIWSKLSRCQTHSPNSISWFSRSGEIIRCWGRWYGACPWQTGYSRKLFFTTRALLKSSHTKNSCFNSASFSLILNSSIAFPSLIFALYKLLLKIKLWTTELICSFGNKISGSTGFYCQQINLIVSSDEFPLQNWVCNTLSSRSDSPTSKITSASAPHSFRANRPFSNPLLQKSSMSGGIISANNSNSARWSAPSCFWTPWFDYWQNERSSDYWVESAHF